MSSMEINMENKDEVIPGITTAHSRETAVKLCNKQQKQLRISKGRESSTDGL